MLIQRLLHIHFLYHHSLDQVQILLVLHRHRNGGTRRQISESHETVPGDTASLVEQGFDENVLRALCDMDVCCPFSSHSHIPTELRCLQCGVPLLLDRIKQSMVSCRASRLRLHIVLILMLYRRLQCS